MKNLLLLLSFLFSYCIALGQKFELYITNDLIINSCFLMWEDAEKKMMKGVEEGKIPLYASLAGKEKITKDNLSQQLSLQVKGDDGKLYFIPAKWELQIQETSAKPVFRLFTYNEINRDTQTAGYVQFDEWLSYLEPEERNFLQLLNESVSPFQQNQILDPSSLYSTFREFSVMLQDKLSGRLVSNESIKKYDKDLKKINTGTADTLAMQLNDITGPDGTIKQVYQRLDSSQMNQGIVVKGKLEDMKSLPQHIGFLYHPEFKYAGYNPGKIPWFYVNAEGLEKSEMETYTVLKEIFRYAILYQINPEKYTCQFYVNTQIKIDNRRYPYR